MPKAKADTELVVIEKTYELLVWTLKHIEKFPRNHRYGIGLRLEQQLQEHPLGQSQQEHPGQPQQQQRIPGCLLVIAVSTPLTGQTGRARTVRSTDRPGAPQCSPPRDPASVE